MHAQWGWIRNAILRKSSTSNRTMRQHFRRTWTKTDYQAYFPCIRGRQIVWERLYWPPSVLSRLHRDCSTHARAYDSPRGELTREFVGSAYNLVSYWSLPTTYYLHATSAVYKHLWSTRSWRRQKLYNYLILLYTGSLDTPFSRLIIAGVVCVVCALLTMMSAKPPLDTFSLLKFTQASLEYQLLLNSFYRWGSLVRGPFFTTREKLVWWTAYSIIVPSTGMLADQSGCVAKVT